MENRYLYRAKRTDNGEWAEGALFDGKESCIIGQNIKFSPYVSLECKIVGFEVDRETICQCTGLKDKNGNMIFENDILLGYLDDSYPEDATYAEVLWWRSGFYTRERGSNDVHEIDAFTEQNYEVIGNIFDNPELLEEQSYER